MLRCVWIFNCCWFHPAGSRDENIYFFAWIGGSWSLTVTERRRMLGLSYSSMLIPAYKRMMRNKGKQREPHSTSCSESHCQSQYFSHQVDGINSPRDNLRGSPFDPPLDVENARPRSTPGITTDVKRPCPLQKSKIAWATLPGVSARTSPARSIFSIVTFSLLVSLCNFSTTLAYGESIPVMRRMSTLQFFNGKSLRLRDIITINGFISTKLLIHSRHKWFHVMRNILTVKRAVQAALKICDNLLLIWIFAGQLLLVCLGFFLS